MIWFEAEQILTYLNSLEQRLDEWSMTALEMRLEKAELERLEKKLARDPEDTLHADYAFQISGRISTLRDSLNERLKR
jgi:hypothetical protein